MTHDCDLCGSTSNTPLPQDDRIAVCQGCGFVHVRERRSSEEIAAAWGAVYGEAYNPEWPGVKARLYYVAEWLDQHYGLAGKTLLDIGAGRGQFMHFAAAKGAYPVGLEPSAANCQHIRSLGLPANHGSIESVAYMGQYDFVTILWTLENCGDCLAMLRWAKEQLAPGGRVVVATGSRILVPFKKALSSYLNPKLPADLHCFRWTPETLCLAFQHVELGIELVNDYRERDELVVVARVDPVSLVALANFNLPDLVLAHFAEWGRLFP